MTKGMDQVIDWTEEGINGRGAIVHGMSCMAESDFNFEDDGRYYTELAAAGSLPTLAADCASIALVCARRTMRESTLFICSRPTQL
jgi:hypothetical protein